MTSSITKYFLSQRQLINMIIKFHLLLKSKVNVLYLSDGIKILCGFGRWYRIKESDFYINKCGIPNNSNHTAQSNTYDIFIIGWFLGKVISTMWLTPVRTRREIRVKSFCERNMLQVVYVWIPTWRKRRIFVNYCANSVGLF